MRDWPSLNATAPVHNVLIIYKLLRNSKFQSYGIQTQAASSVNFGSMMSSEFHDQLDSYLCWVYSFSSSTKSSLKLFINGLKLPQEQKQRCFSRLNSKEFHHRLRNEVCMVIPTYYKESGEHQAANLRPVMIRVSSTR